MHLEDLGLIGNCQISALIERSGAIVWCCLPRFDSEPVFSTLLDERAGGDFQVAPADGAMGVQRYVENTNVLETTFRGTDGAFRVVDFAPRFAMNDRMFRPTQLLRMVEPIEGTPRIRVRCAPRLGWTKKEPGVVLGSNHASYQGFDGLLRLTTDLPLARLDGQPFTLTERRHLALAWGAPIEEPLPALFDRFLGETVRYWQRWVKQCNVPPVYQQAVIRSALALKLHCFDDTGAIVASMTTSIPEAPGSGRTWDYRYCWLRDAYYTLEAFRRLGHFDEREAFTRYLLDIAGSADELSLRPLYRIDGRSDLDERILPDWPGFGGSGPVRVGNAAALQSQNDIFGEMVLSLVPIFLDDRYTAERSKAALSLIERLARKAIAVAGKADAGIWELRTEATPQTFSSLMSWAAAERMSRVAGRHAPAHAAEFGAAADRIRAEIESRAFDPGLGSFVGSYGGKDLDASLLQMTNLRLLPPRDARLHGTVDAVVRALSRDGWLLRYQMDDGFGTPAVAFTICTFWLVESLAVIGRMDEARAVMNRVHAVLSPLGLLSEDYDPRTQRMWGNFPQAYSHVGLIHAAFAASPHWSEVL